MKRLLSKSQVNQFLQCPLKWKYLYIDLIPSVSSVYQKRGINIHSKIENLYKRIKLIKEKDSKIPSIEIEEDEDLVNFINFERERIKSCVDKEGNFDLKYFKPLHQELKLQNEKLGLKGIIDTVYIHPKDDGIIILDWKTGKYYGNKLDDYRFELAVYTELLRAEGKLDNIKYWGIYFTDADKLFFEKIELKYIVKMYNIINEVRKEMESGNYPARKNEWCWCCQFKDKCKEQNVI